MAQIATALLPRVSRAASVAAGGQGGPEAVQAQYDAARDLQEALAAAPPAGPACRPLAAILTRYAQAQVSGAEGVDRLRPAQTTRSRAAAARALAGYPEARAACLAHPAIGTRAAHPPEIDDPASFEAFFGAVRARAPAGAVRATVTFDGAVVARADLEGGWLRTRIAGAPAHGRLVVTFATATGGVAGRSVSEDVWLLPAIAAGNAPGARADVRLGAKLARAAAGFSGISAVYTLDLQAGVAGSWNADARFPAASTVKLGVLAAALARFGPRPERHSSFADLQALAGWSSNLAANRLLAKIGGSASRGAARAEDELRRLGARRARIRATTSWARRSAARRHLSRAA